MVNRTTRKTIIRKTTSKTAKLTITSIIEALKPYHSWEKGTVENINGLIRRFFPKGTSFDRISSEEIAYVEDWINNRPMKNIRLQNT